MIGRFLKNDFEVPSEYKKAEAAFGKKNSHHKQAQRIETGG